MRLPGMNKRLGWIYGLLVALLVAMGSWWVYFLAQEGRVHATYRRQQAAGDSLHAVLLLAADPDLAARAPDSLAAAFPGLVFQEGPADLDVSVDPAVLAEIEREARATQNMFLYEGIFFLLLLAAGSALLVHSWRNEMRYKQARELFLAGATHEFKTPLASLRLYTETLGRTGLTDQAAQDIRIRMVEDITRLEGLVDNVLAMSADRDFASGPRVRIDLGATCLDVIQDLEPYARDRGATVTLQVAADAFILGRRPTLVLALRNLLVNAVVHGRPPVAIHVGLTTHGPWHHLTVRDNGPGIPRRLQDKVFTCFFTGSPAPGGVRGAGLGLYLVKRNVQDLGGRIELKSDPGQGCLFTLVLPAYPPPAQGEPT